MEKSASEIQREKLVEQFREELPVLRAKRRLSQENVAEAIGISRQTYSMIETGKKEMSWTIFLALVTFFQSDTKTKKLLEHTPNFSDLQSILNKYLS